MKRLFLLLTLLISFSSISQVGTFTFNTLTVRNISDKEIVSTISIDTSILLDLNNGIIILNHDDKVIYYSTDNNSFKRSNDDSYSSILLKNMDTGEIIRLYIMDNDTVIIINNTYLFSLYNKPN